MIDLGFLDQWACIVHSLVVIGRLPFKEMRENDNSTKSVCMRIWSYDSPASKSLFGCPQAYVLAPFCGVHSLPFPVWPWPVCPVADCLASLLPPHLGLRPATEAHGPSATPPSPTTHTPTVSVGAQPWAGQSCPCSVALPFWRRLGTRLSSGVPGRLAEGL